MIKYLKLLSLVLALTILFSSCTIKELFSLTPPEDISPPNQENPGETDPPVNVPTDFTIAHYTGCLLYTSRCV